MKTDRTDREARVLETVDVLRAAVKDAAMAITADLRVGEADAAVLIGYAPRTLATMRGTFGSGPTWYRAPVDGAQYSYRLQDLARWIEEKREGAGL